MTKLRSIATKDFFQAFVSMGSAEAREGLARLRERIASEFSSSSVTYREGQVHVQLRDVDALGDKNLTEKVSAAIAAAFPHLAAGSPTLYNDALGELTWDDECEGFEGQVAVDGNQIDVVLLASSEPTSSPAIQRARDVVLRWSDWWRNMQPSIIQKCLSLYNDEWRNCDEAGSGLAITESEFLSRLSPTTLQVEADHRFKMYFDADGMFTEHGITVEVLADGQVMAYLE